ncbi:nucleotidyl transferase AbiEii/AbiGii toxin family protein [Sphingobacterium hotanense]|uniref:nucleotidyl transferase AbiEii/AbiGii toxin family protein n=1 Tax=Sphingobacterium hotanense TaxID=649196 RepID=UPI0011F0AB49|nr:nucleotidyl transferase AbiEii/AbiGii toxin family protein [Sphingobacterium hotanense]
MILKKEIEKKALEHEVSRNTIDKDWVLGHFVDAIFSIDSCREALIFKGETCLRKCYIADYRFSEDLDFTSINPDFQLDIDLLQQIMSLVQEWIFWSKLTPAIWTKKKSPSAFRGC